MLNCIHLITNIHPVMFVVITYRVTRVKGAFVDYMALPESQDPLVQRQGTIYCALMRLDFCSLHAKRAVQLDKNIFQVKLS